MSSGQAGTRTGTGQRGEGAGAASAVSRSIGPLRGPSAVHLALCLSLQLLSAEVPAEVFKWVDESGRVHYGDSRPRDIESEALEEFVPPSPEDVSDAERRLEEMLKRDRARSDRREEAREDAREALREEQSRLARCRAARAELRVLELQRPVYRLDPSGNPIFLEDDQRASEIAGARERIRYYCQP